MSAPVATNRRRPVWAAISRIANGCLPCATPSPFSPPLACSLCRPRPPRGPRPAPMPISAPATDDSAYSPEQRIAACGALIDTLNDQPQAQAAALVNRGATYWYYRQDRHLRSPISLAPSRSIRTMRGRSASARTPIAASASSIKALTDANDAVRLDPNDAQAFDYRGNVFNNNDQYDRAIADYNEALRLKPDDSQTLYGPRRRLLLQEGLSGRDRRLRPGDQARSEEIARLYQPRRRL